MAVGIKKANSFKYLVAFQGQVWQERDKKATGKEPFCADLGDAARPHYHSADGCSHGKGGIRVVFLRKFRVGGRGSER